MISGKELAATVKDMRDLQKDYFKTRDPIVLQKCKAIESKVDNMVKAVLNHEPEEKQLNLFK